MKVSKTAWLILGIGIFVIAFATLYTVYSRQVGEEEQLQGSLSGAQALLPKLIAEKEDFESQLTQWEGELAKATSALTKSKTRFLKPVESIEYDETLFDIADDCDLEIVELTASEPRDEKVEDVTYATTSFKVKVRPVESPPKTGDFDIYIDETLANILEFIHTIATGEDFTTATIEVVSMEKLEPPEEDKDAEKPEATIELVIYGYQGE